MANRGCPSESDQKCHPEAKQQWAKPSDHGTANEDERQGQNQRSIRNDEVVQAPWRAQDVVRAAGVWNGSLRDGIMNQCNPKRKKHDCNRSAHHHRDGYRATHEGWHRYSLAVLAVEDYE